MITYGENSIGSLSISGSTLTIKDANGIMTGTDTTESKDIDGQDPTKSTTMVTDGINADMAKDGDKLTKDSNSVNVARNINLYLRFE